MLHIVGVWPNVGGMEWGLMMGVGPNEYNFVKLGNLSNVDTLEPNGGSGA